MWIEKLRLKSFLLFNDADIKFNRGFNLVLYPNESGKSSLFKALVTIFFKSVFSGGKKIASLKNWSSDSLFALEGVVHFGDKVFRLVKDYEEREQDVYSLPEETLVAKGRSVDAFLKKRILIADEELFLRLCGVRHEELDLVRSGSRSIGEEVEGILSGSSGDVSCEEVLKQLAGYRSRLMKGLEKPAKKENWGILKRLKTEIGELEENLKRVQEIASERRELSRRLSEKRQDVLALKKELEVKREMLKRFEELSRLDEEEKRKSADADGLRKRLEKAKKLGEEMAELSAKETEIPQSLRGFTKDDIIRLRSAVEREIGLEKEVPRAETRKPKIVPSWRLPAFLAILLLLILTAFSIFGADGGNLRLVAVSVAVFLLILDSIWLWASLRGRGASPSVEAEEYTRFISERKKWSGDVEAVAALKMVNSALGLLEEKEHLGIRIDELLDGEGKDLDRLCDSLDKEFGEVSIALRGIMEKKKELERFRIHGEDVVKLEDEVSSLSKRLEEAEGMVAELSSRLGSLEDVDEADITERLSDAKARISRYEAKVWAVDIAIETIEKARKMVAGYIATRLPPLAGRYLAKITSHRYETLEIDPVTLDMEVVSSDGPSDGGGDSAVVSSAGSSDGGGDSAVVSSDGPSDGSGDSGVVSSAGSSDGGGDSATRRIPLGSLSKGTADQVYMSVRIALVDLLGSIDPLPIILDDPFVHFDDDRRWEALELLQEFSREHQIIFLSCETDRRFPDVYRVDLPHA